MTTNKMPKQRIRLIWLIVFHLLLSPFFLEGCEKNHNDNTEDEFAIKIIAELSAMRRNDDLEICHGVKSDKCVLFGSVLLFDSANLENKRKAGDYIVRKACLGGHDGACRLLSYNSPFSVALPRDERGIDLSSYKNACEKGAGESCLQLGRFFWRGIEGRRNINKSNAYFKRACELGEPNGCSALASYILFDESFSCSDNWKKAREQYRVGCKAGYATSCNILSYLDERWCLWQRDLKTVDEAYPANSSNKIAYLKYEQLKKRKLDNVNQLRTLCLRKNFLACSEAGNILCSYGDGECEKGVELLKVSCENGVFCTRYIARTKRNIDRDAIHRSFIQTLNKGCNNGDGDACFELYLVKSNVEKQKKTERSSHGERYLLRSCIKGSQKGCKKLVGLMKYQ